MILLRVRIGAGGNSVYARIANLRIGFNALDVSARPLHDLFGEFVVHGRLARLGDNQQRLVITAVKTVSRTPGEIKAGKLREALALAFRHAHQAHQA